MKANLYWTRVVSGNRYLPPDLFRSIDLLHHLPAICDKRTFAQFLWILTLQQPNDKKNPSKCFTLVSLIVPAHILQYNQLVPFVSLSICPKITSGFLIFFGVENETSGMECVNKNDIPVLQINFIKVLVGSIENIPPVEDYSINIVCNIKTWTTEVSWRVLSVVLPFKLIIFIAMKLTP